MAFARAVANGAAPGARDKGEEAEGAPVTMQVPEKELKAFVSKLSPACESQFTQILSGNSEVAAADGSSAKCSQAKGGVCSTDAHVTQVRDEAGSGRSMKSSTRVTGKSCLPRHCMDGDDLKVFADFMHGKAKETLAGAGINIALRVDCTGSGGSRASVGARESPSPPAPGAQTAQAAAEAAVGKPMRVKRSASTSLAPSAALLAAVALGAAAAA